MVLLERFASNDVEKTAEERNGESSSGDSLDACSYFSLSSRKATNVRVCLVDVMTKEEDNNREGESTEVMRTWFVEIKRFKGWAKKARDKIRIILLSRQYRINMCDSILLSSAREREIDVLSAAEYYCKPAKEK